MTKPKITKAQQIADLQRRLGEAYAASPSTYSTASRDLSKASTDHLMASGVVVTITALGGRVITPPVLIRDGLSHDTIAALQADIARSFKLSVSHTVVGETK